MNNKVTLQLQNKITITLTENDLEKLQHQALDILTTKGCLSSLDFDESHPLSNELVLDAVMAELGIERIFPLEQE